MVVTAVFFDVGSTIVDETRMFQSWAAVLGVGEDLLLEELTRTIERREHHWEVFAQLRPDIAPEEWRRQLGPVDYRADDLYPDVLECLVGLHSGGFLIGLAGNQPAEATGILRGLGLTVDLVASSADWSVAKPDPTFFACMARSAGRPATEIAYVGDRVDNDVVPAADAGMAAIFLRRGPWAAVQAEWPEAGRAALTLDSLADLPDALRSVA